MSVGVGVSTTGATAVALCSTGFCTWVLFTDCMMIGECVLAWRADHACMDEVREEDDSMDEAGDGDTTGTGLGPVTDGGTACMVEGGTAVEEATIGA